jgi:probable phosphoglycerate mutase
VAGRLAEAKIDAIYTSPLRRTRQTASEIARHHPIVVTPAAPLIDFDYGAWQGRTPAAVRAAEPRRYALWLTDPARARLPRGESLLVLRMRILRFVEDVARWHAGATVVLVSHEMVGRVLVTALLGLPLRAVWRIGQDNGAISVFDKRREGWTVAAVNDVAHVTPLPSDP